MTAIWFLLAAIALVGAGALLYFDRIQRQRVGRVRQIWAKAQGYSYTPADPNLPSTWQRGALAKQDYLSAVDIVSGVRRGEQFFLFDLEEAATIIAVRREVGSDVDIDLRLKSTPPPRDTDLELLGAIGPRIMFATDLEIARRVCDQRMITYTEGLPSKLQLLWSEGMWTLGSLPVATSSREWEASVDAVAKLSGMLHVLPPARQAYGLSQDGHDPGRPQTADQAAATIQRSADPNSRVMAPPRYPAPERARMARPPGDFARQPVPPTQVAQRPPLPPLPQRNFDPQQTQQAPRPPAPPRDPRRVPEPPRHGSDAPPTERWTEQDPRGPR